MKIEITLPQIGESVTEAVVNKWLKNVGQDIEKYEPIVEIITDKVSMEIPSPHTGKLIEKTVSEGETVPMGNIIAVFDVTDVDDNNQPNDKTVPDQSIIGSISDVAAVGPTGGEFKDNSLIHEDLPKQTREDKDVDEVISTDLEKNRYSPVVLKLADQHGIDITDVSGSGQNNRVTKKDVLNHIDKVNADEVNVKNTISVGAADDFVTPNPVRKIIADRMVESSSKIPHAWTSVEVDMTEVKKCIDSNRESFRRLHNIKLTYLTFAVYAVSRGLTSNKYLNSSWIDNKILLRGNVNLGIAIAGLDGLSVPVIHNADALGFLDICKKLSDLTRRARNGELQLNDVEGGTFTVNNTGTLGSILGGAIINYPQAGIITTESVVRRPMVRISNNKEDIQIRAVMNMCLSFDHRIVDGLEASNFVQAVKNILESINIHTKLT